VQQPFPGDRTVIDFEGERSVGHTFIRLDFGDGRVYYRGFYPASPMGTKEIALKKDVDGKVHKEESPDFENQHPWDVAKVYTINNTNATNMYNFMINFNENYNMVTNNCTTFAVRALQAGNISPPTTEHSWKLPPDAKEIVVEGLPAIVPGKGIIADNILKDLRGYTPADTGEDIKLATGQYFLCDDQGVHLYEK
jgi:hypothetical protein